MEQVAVEEVQEILVPRYVYEDLEEVVASYTLHGFGDASEKAYCHVVYLVLEVINGYYPVLVHI